jgi:zinc protease
MDIIFRGGRPHERKRLTSRATSRILRDGAGPYNTATIAERFDFFGSILENPHHLDTCHLAVTMLAKHFEGILPYVAEMMHRPTFPESELRQYIKRSKRRLSVDLKKPETIAFRKITELIFGASHPYGYNNDMDMYEALERAELVEHFERCYNRKNGFIMVSGMVKEEVVDQLNRYLGDLREGQRAHAELEVLDSVPPQRVRIEFQKAEQCAVRIGRRLFTRHHPDYCSLYLLNTVLGGYFGSRLMSNIREEKGHTYNIYSSIETMEYDGFWFVGAEVNPLYLQETIEEIYREMEILREELIDEQELYLARNYVLGTFLAMIDGPFNLAELARGMLIESLPWSHFDELVSTVRSIDAKKLRELARRYLRQEYMYEVIVGPNQP